MTAFANSAPADLVIGQPDFYSGDPYSDGPGPTAGTLFEPTAAAVDGAGNLYVSDSQSNRVLEYNQPFAGCGVFPCVGGSANLVFGQGGSFTSRDCNIKGVRVDADSLCTPLGVAIDAVGNLYVADRGNSRVLEYNSPLSTDTTADTVFGQNGSFNTASCNGPDNMTISADTLCDPSGVAVDAGGNLYISDELNNRVLGYKTPLSTDTTADMVFGQGGSFSSNGLNTGGLSADSLFDPEFVTTDAFNDLYIADHGNNRMLEYKTPFSTDTTADVVFGQEGSYTNDVLQPGRNRQRRYIVLSSRRRHRRRG